jgi:alcohol dehydrogenase, propanol-preferring
MGVGGLGSYATQYAKLLGGGATVVAMARSEHKLTVAKGNGADHTINVRDKGLDDVRADLDRLSGRSELDAVIECDGSVGSVRPALALIGTQGAVASVDPIGNRIDVPLFPFVGREFGLLRIVLGQLQRPHRGSRLAEAGQIKHAVTRVRFDDANETLDAVARGEVIGRAVIV